jgi:hypothetical protein
MPMTTVGIGAGQRVGKQSNALAPLDYRHILAPEAGCGA